MSDSMADLPDSLTGYQSTEDYIAQQTQQGNRINYHITLPIHRVVEVFPIPDPDQEFEDNRRVDAKRAKKFARYVRTTEKWTAGSLQVRSDPKTCKFDAQKDYGPMSLGTIQVPAGNRGNFHILDGQHRILGFKYLLEQIGTDLSEARRQLQIAENAGNPSPEIARRTKTVKELERLRDRFFNESIGVQVVIETNHVAARKIFVDVNDNAKGVPRSVTARFNRDKVAERALQRMIDEGPVHPLLIGRVDEQKDRVTSSNPNFVAASKLADLIRFTHKGIYGRYRAEMDADVSLDDELVTSATRFLDVLTAAAPQLQQVIGGSLTTTELRGQNMVGSITMLSVLAGAFHNLSNDGVSDKDIELFFARLIDHMDVPVTNSTRSGKMWLNAGKEEAFVDGATAPVARAQQVKELVGIVTGWFANPPNGL